MSSETALVRRGTDALLALLPEGWTARLASGKDADVMLRIRSPDKVAALVVVEAKRRVTPGSVAGLRATFERFTDAVPLVMAGWLSPLSRAELTASGIGYVDLTGNVDFRMSRPGLYVRATGADRDPEPQEATLKTLRGAGVARAVRAFVDFEPPYGVRELAAVSGATAPVISRVAALLEKERLVDRTRGSIQDVVWDMVLRRWGEDYGFATSNRVVPCLDPRGIQGLLERLKTSKLRWALTGTLGVPPGAAVAPAPMAAIYVETPERALQNLRLTPVTAGANVLLVEPPDEGAFARSLVGEDGVVRAAPSQVVADLLTGPGRGSSEGDALIEWMRRNQKAWRRRP